MINVWGIEFDIDKIVENFNFYQSFAKAKEIHLEDIPQDIMEKFENLSRRFIPSAEYKPKDFIFSLKTNFDNGDYSYSVLHPVIYNRGKLGKEAREFDLYSRELDKTGKSSGRFELRYNLRNDSYFINKPFVGRIKTKEDFRRQGLGIRKHKTMNALSHAIYGLALHSDTSNLENEKKLLEKLFSLGEVTHYFENGKDRFCFP
ncbi:MAG: hypothetical protein AABX99_03360 [Nanoarchaeota archaeon]